MKKNEQHTAGERTAFTLEELNGNFNGSIVRQKRGADSGVELIFHHSILDNHFRTGITCQECFRIYLSREHGLYGWDADEYCRRFEYWFVMPKSTMFVVLGFSDISEHQYDDCNGRTRIIRNDFSVNLMVIGHENVKAYNGLKDWKRTNPVEPPQYVQLAFGTKRRNTQVNNKNLFTKRLEVIETP